jgi:hypothetical protein
MVISAAGFDYEYLDYSGPWTDYDDEEMSVKVQVAVRCPKEM